MPARYCEARSGNCSPEKGSFILAYMVNDGYSRQIIEWHEKNKNVEVHCFWDKKGEPEVKEVHENLTFHQLNAEKFLQHDGRVRRTR